MASRGPIVGIDLGTTNSLVAVAEWGDDARPRCLPDEHGRVMLPSVVRFEADGGVVVGAVARDEAVTHPQRTVSSVKRLMGRSARDAAGDVPYLSYRVVEGANQTARVELPGGGVERHETAMSGSSAPVGGVNGTRVVSPQEVSAIILRELKARASRVLGVDVTRAVVTVPAYFDDAQRQATRDAGRLAGLEVVRIVNEPTAAALAYGIGTAAQSAGEARLGEARSRGTGNVIVYDLGGGTFDVSVLRLTAGENDFFQVLATAGDTHLGGDDFDQALVGMFSREISERLFSGAALELPAQTRQALRQLAERARVRLSEHETAAVRIDVGEGRVYERTITRGELEALIGPLVERTIECCKRAMRDAKRELAGESLTAVVLVGGATRTPLVRKRVGEVFGMTPYTALNPDEVVALGAAVQGAMLARSSGEAGPGGKAAATRALLLDVVPLSLGLETVGGAMAKLIMRNSTVPTRAHEMFSTSVDGQSSIKLNVLQGEREMSADCRSLGVFHLRGIPPMPAGIPKLRVEFAVDANGILSVSAVEERSGKRLDVQIVPNHGLSQDEVERLERESFAHAREDMARHRIADLIANARLDVGWIEKAIARVEAGEAREVKGAGVELEPGYVAGLRSRVSGLKAMIESAEGDWRSVDADGLHHAKEELDRASVRLHEVAIARSLREGGER